MGIDVPKEIREQIAKVKPWMSFYIQAYVDLSTDTNDRGYIEWRAIDCYAHRYGFEDWGFEWFKRCVRAIEDHVQTKRPTQSKETKNHPQEQSAP